MGRREGYEPTFSTEVTSFKQKMTEEAGVELEYNMYKIQQFNQDSLILDPVVPVSVPIRIFNLSPPPP